MIHELFLSCFLAFPRSKKIYQRNITLKHALVNNNKESIIE